MRWIIVSLLAPCFIFTALDAKADNNEAEIKKIQSYQDQMRTTPDRVSPDSLYTGYSLEKIYYQNREIIKLLKDIGKNMPGPGREADMIELLREIRALLEAGPSDEASTNRPRVDAEFLQPKR